MANPKSDATTKRLLDAFDALDRQWRDEFPKPVRRPSKPMRRPADGLGSSDENLGPAAEACHPSFNNNPLY